DQDPTHIDYNEFLQAFAKRGAGVGAVAPDRYSLTNNGVTESTNSGNDLTFVSLTVNDDVVTCDKDNNLDTGEQGHLTVTLRNDATVNAPASRRANLDEVSGQSATDDAETASSAWSSLNLGVNAGAKAWVKQELAFNDHNYFGADQGMISDIALTSGTWQVGVATFIISFQHRFGFEFSGTTWFDGGVVEISTDSGGTWTDIGN